MYHRRRRQTSGGPSLAIYPSRTLASYLHYEASKQELLAISDSSAPKQNRREPNQSVSISRSAASLVAPMLRLRLRKDSSPDNVLRWRSASIYAQCFLRTHRWDYILTAPDPPSFRCFVSAVALQARRQHAKTNITKCFCENAIVSSGQNRTF